MNLDLLGRRVPTSADRCELVGGKLSKGLRQSSVEGAGVPRRVSGPLLLRLLLLDTVGLCVPRLTRGLGVATRVRRLLGMLPAVLALLARRSRSRRCSRRRRCGCGRRHPTLFSLLCVGVGNLRRSLPRVEGRRGSCKVGILRVRPANVFQELERGASGLGGLLVRQLAGAFALLAPLGLGRRRVLARGRLLLLAAAFDQRRRVLGVREGLENLCGGAGLRLRRRCLRVVLRHSGLGSLRCLALLGLPLHLAEVAQQTLHAVVRVDEAGERTVETALRVFLDKRHAAFFELPQILHGRVLAPTHALQHLRRDSLVVSVLGGRGHRSRLRRGRGRAVCRLEPLNKRLDVLLQQGRCRCEQLANGRLRQIDGSHLLGKGDAGGVGKDRVVRFVFLPSDFITPLEDKLELAFVTRAHSSIDTTHQPHFIVLQRRLFVLPEAEGIRLIVNVAQRVLDASLGTHLKESEPQLVRNDKEVVCVETSVLEHVRRQRALTPVSGLVLLVDVDAVGRKKLAQAVGDPQLLRCRPGVEHVDNVEPKVALQPLDVGGCAVQHLHDVLVGKGAQQHVHVVP
eukprot:Rhum_TRINITY_DN15181_c18_g1::Rhum_TRINITY_DN15181_c18_g1_i1::g.143406::m.143406